MKAISKNIIPISIAVILWVLSIIFKIDKLFFTYDHIEVCSIVSKIVALIMLLSAWIFVFFVIRRAKEKDEIYIRGVHIFIIYFSFILCFLFLIYPGTWAWDDLGTLNIISTYKSFHPWQHILTGIYQDALLQILPFPGGIIILQNFIISICVAFSVVRLEVCFNLKKLKSPIMDMIVKLIPFLLPPVIMYQMSGYRNGLYVYLEVVMIVELLSLIINKENISWGKLVGLAFIIVIVSTWRTESFIYIPFICFMVVSKYITINKVKKFTCIVFVLCGYILVNYFQKEAIVDENYKIMSLIRPAVELVRESNIERDAKELDEIDDVLDLHVIYDNPTMNGEELYWGTGCVRTRNETPDDDYSIDDYKEFTNAVVSLSFKYPQVVIYDRLRMFVGASGIRATTVNNVDDAAKLFEENNDNFNATQMLSSRWILNKPLSVTVRRNIIYILGTRTFDGEKIKILHLIVWNLLVPIIALIYVWFKLLKEKRWDFWWVCTAILVRGPIIFLTEPAPWFMYWLSFYELGWLLVVYGLVRRCR